MSQLDRKRDDVRQLLDKMMPEFKKILHDDKLLNKFIRVALSEFSKIPKLLECTQESLLGGLMNCAQLGLELGSATSQAWLIPYGKQATLVIGYRGMRDLVFRSNRIANLWARVVRENDKFEFSYGTNEKIDHVPAKGKRGEITHFYAVAQTIHRTVQFEIMTYDEVERIRKRSRAKADGPWVTDYEPMGCKTVLRKLCKYLPTDILPPLAHEVLHREDQEFYADANARVAAKTDEKAAALRERLDAAEDGFADTAETLGIDEHEEQRILAAEAAEAEGELRQEMAQDDLKF